ncbi:MAG: hypothetical protein R3E96_00685 [Planctomycetota bacterium]
MRFCLLVCSLLTAAILLSAPAPALQTPYWRTAANNSRYMETLDALDLLRTSPDYIESLQRRIDSTAAAERGQVLDAADLYLELLFLAANDEPALDQAFELTKQGGTYHTWPSDWDLESIAGPIVHDWGPDDPRWCLAFAILEDCLITYLSSKSSALQNQGLEHHLKTLEERFHVPSPEGITLAAINNLRIYKTAGPLAASHAYRPWIAAVSWQKLLQASFTAFSSLSVNEFRSLMLEGRDYEADQLSRGHYEMEWKAIDQDPGLSKQWSSICAQILVWEQAQLGNGTFCYSFARDLVDPLPIEQTDFEHLTAYFRAMVATMEQARTSPDDVSREDVEYAEKTLTSVLERDSALYLHCLSIPDGARAEQFPSRAGFQLAEYAATLERYGAASEILHKIELLPESAAASPMKVRRQRLRYRLLKSEGNDPSVIEEASDFFTTEWESALEQEQYLQQYKGGSALLAEDRLGEALDTRLMVEWQGQQGGPLPNPPLHGFWALRSPAAWLAPWN